ncbi:MAG: hypothetical protein BWY09_02596 [Candidatus Hydrogenedentes bacterium ADurb.Bin179]|nr:MAG: hypothetical protein BWY09_02596 [Candidatus Hydrogenedentes bacterium ADurb.Bin179]
MVVLDPQVKHAQGTVNGTMVGRGGEHVQRRTWYGTDAHFHQGRAEPAVPFPAVFHLPRHMVGEGVKRQRVVAVGRARIRSVGITDPETGSEAVLPVDIIPARVDQLSVIIDGRVPFTGFKVTKRQDSRPVLVHGKKRVAAHFEVSVKAADVTAAPFRHEGNTAVGQPAGIKIIIGPVRQLHQVGAIHVDLEQMKSGLLRKYPAVLGIFSPGKDNGFAVIGQVRGGKGTVIQFSPLQSAVLNHRIRQDIDDFRNALILPNPVKAAAGQGIKTEILRHEMAALRVGRLRVGPHRTFEGAPGHTQNLLKVQQRIGQRQPAAYGTRGQVPGFIGQGIRPRRILAYDL